MDDLLHELDDIVGVQGACVFGGDGAILASTLPEGIPAESLHAVGRTFTRTLEALRVARRRKVSDADLLYESGRLVVKNLADGCMLIQCTPTINVPLLNLTANVVARKVNERMKGKAPAAASAPAAEALVAPTATPTAPVASPMAAGTPLQRMALDLVEKARAAKATLRVMGKGAVRMRSPSASRLAPGADEENLIQFGVRGNQTRHLEKLLEAEAYLSDRRFNALFGRERMRFGQPETKVLVEIFLDALISYHRLEFGSRLHIDEHTLPLADLLLAQLQNVKASEGELQLVACLFADADLGGPGQPAAIDTTHIAELCADDWGWYRTVTLNLERCVAVAPAVLEGEPLERATRRMGRLRQMLEEAPKTLRWQVRARVGESRRWYEEAE